MLSALMLDVLKENTTEKLHFPCQVVADWLQDQWGFNKEAMCYETRFRRTKVTLSDVVGVLTKFGNKKERSAVSKWRREVSYPRGD